VGGYAFGDGVPASRRLALVAEVLEPPSRAFLERFAGRALSLAIDLACGPGHTTLLLHAVLHPRRTLGLDQSVMFLELARAAARDGMAFIQHDVTTVPFPEGPADLAYCRRLEVDPLLEELADPEGLRRVDSRVMSLSPPTPLVGEMFGLNLTVWREDPLAAALATPAVLDEIAAGLHALARAEDSGTITWRLPACLTGPTTDAHLVLLPGITHLVLVDLDTGEREEWPWRRRAALGARSWSWVCTW
jgi:trans-aconitate 2-methyltransferase